MLALFDELRLNGFIEGQNLLVLPGGFEVGNDNLPELAAVLVKAAPDAIVAGPALVLRAVQSVTSTIPIIGMTEDMVAEGLVASFARPGGNITGISLLSPELDGKRLEILPFARQADDPLRGPQWPPETQSTVIERKPPLKPGRIAWQRWNRQRSAEDKFR